MIVGTGGGLCSFSISGGGDVFFLPRRDDLGVGSFRTLPLLVFLALGVVSSSPGEGDTGRLFRADLRGVGAGEGVGSGDMSLETTLSERVCDWVDVD